MSRRQEAAALLCRYETRALALSAFAMWLVAPTPCAWSRTVVFLGVALGKSFGWGATYDKLYVPLLLATAYCCQRYVERPYSDYQRWHQAKGEKGCDDRCIEAVDACCASLCKRS